MVDILVVEDEYTERRELARMMEEVTEPDCIRCASNCDEAMERITERCPDLILLDIMLRGRSGFEVAKFVRDHQLECQIIILTAYHEFEFANQAMALNIREYLLKPVRPAMLLQRIRKVLQSPGGQAVEQRRLWPSLECGLSEGVAVPACSIPNVILIGVLDRPLDDQTEFLSQSNLATRGVGWTEAAQRRLVGYCRALEDEATAAAQHWKEIWNTHLPEDHRLLSVGVGSFAKAPHDLPESYRTANLAVKGRLLRPEEEICRYTPWNGPALPYPVRLESRLLHQIRTGRQAELERDCRQLCTVFLQDCQGDALLLERWLDLLCAALFRLCAEAAVSYMPHLELQYLTQREELYLLLQAECTAVQELLVTAASPKHPLVQSTAAIVQARFREPLKLQEVAREQFVNPAYLGRLFHAQMGQSFRDYLTQVRMRHAVQLLREKWPVSDVAEAVGYGDPNYFSRVYKAQFGCSPTEGRE